VVIVPPIVQLELFGEVLKRVKGMRGVEPFIVFSMTALDFSIMPGCEGTDLFVPYPIFGKALLKECQICHGGCIEAFREFRTVVSLYAFDRHRKHFDQVFQKDSGRIRVMLIERFHIPPPGVFVNRRVLIELLSSRLIDQANGGHILHIDLDALPRILHLLIRLGDVFGISRLDRHDPLPLHDAIEPGDGTGIAMLPELDPEDNQTSMRIPSAHIGDEFKLLRGMLVGMAVRAPGTVAEGTPGTVVAVHPAVDVLPVDAVADRGLCNAVLLRVLN